MRSPDIQSCIVHSTILDRYKVDEDRVQVELVSEDIAVV